MQDWLHYIYNGIEGTGITIIGIILRDLYKYYKLPKEHKLQKQNEKINRKIEKLNRKKTK